MHAPFLCVRVLHFPVEIPVEKWYTAGIMGICVHNADAINLTFGKDIIWEEKKTE